MTRRRRLVACRRGTTIDERRRRRGSSVSMLRASPPRTDRLRRMHGSLRLGRLRRELRRTRWHKTDTCRKCQRHIRLHSRGVGDRRRVKTLPTTRRDHPRWHRNARRRRLEIPQLCHRHSRSRGGRDIISRRNFERDCLRGSRRCWRFRQLGGRWLQRRS